MIKETEAEEAVVSSMRITVKVARNLGIFMILFSCAMVAAIFMFNKGYELLAFLTVLVSTGAGMITGVSLAKAWQAQKE